MRGVISKKNDLLNNDHKSNNYRTVERPITMVSHLILKKKTFLMVFQSNGNLKVSLILFLWVVVKMYFSRKDFIIKTQSKKRFVIHIS